MGSTKEGPWRDGVHNGCLVSGRELLANLWLAREQIAEAFELFFLLVESLGLRQRPAGIGFRSNPCVGETSLFFIRGLYLVLIPNPNPFLDRGLYVVLTACGLLLRDENAALGEGEDDREGEGEGEG